MPSLFLTTPFQAASFLAGSFLAALLAPASASAQAGQPWPAPNAAVLSQPAVVSGLEAMRAVAMAFERDAGRPMGNEFVGFLSEASDVGAVARALTLGPAGATRAQAFDCGPSSGGAFACAARGEPEASTYRPRLGRVDPRSFVLSANDALRDFARASSSARAHRAKFWQFGNEVQIALWWRSAGSQAERTYRAMCHQHGAEFDCHSQSRPVPNEPQD